MHSAPRTGPQQSLGRFGIFSHELRSEDPALQEQRRRAAAELEELGFGVIWLGGNSSVHHAGALAGSTERIALATGILNIWQEDAATVARQRAELEEAHPGRFLLGLGASHAQLAQNYQRPYSTMVGYLDALDNAATPVPADRRILAALGPKMLRLARDRAAGAHPAMVTPEYIKQAREVLGDGPLLAPVVTVVLESDPVRARAIARDFLELYLRLPNYTTNFERLGFTADDFTGGGSDRLVDALVAWGTDDAISERLTEFHTAGADHLALQLITAEGGETPPLTQWRRLAGVSAKSAYPHR
ncbi:LLM class F420-dependent oxidoreductase [Streptomyces sp. NBC_00268]|uniref:LLM class F420-dependent oxidoreductase n=1 Tax=Streptomyces sp. NBC_00268 TaxID=2975695 RepID=UPI002258B744|nr:LLM class F420-dependent oxidoreductase [Streptomyces sp. NBC_00268]MCX5191927.1 LLM class F420-dependent oxidoreductase [Streptomyces sp. NBC_00268]